MTEPTRRAVAAAGHSGDEATVRLGLVATEPAVRASALGALERLGRLGDDELVASFADDDAAVRRRAASIAARHVDVPLAALLDDVDAAVVEVAAWACGEHERVADAELERLLGLAGGAGRGEDPLVRESAVAALGAIGDERGLDAILRAIDDKPAVRRRAVLALAPFVDPDHARAAEVDAALTRALTDRDWQVRQAAEDIRDP